MDWQNCRNEIYEIIGEGGAEMGSTRYISSMGELTRKDNSLCFRKDGKNVYIPIENTKEIYCLNEVSINSKLLDSLVVRSVRHPSSPL